MTNLFVEYVLFYLDVKEALFLPGITSTRFQLQVRVRKTVFPDSSLFV